MLKPVIRSIEWYISKYGEDWAEIVRDEDIKLQRNSDGTYPKLELVAGRDTSPSASWASHPINNQ